MKRTVFLILLLSSMDVTLPGQPTFQKYYYGGGSFDFNIFELSSGNLLVGMAYESGTSIMNHDGNILHAHHYAIDTFKVLQSIMKISENKYAFVSAYGVINTTYNPVIGMMDSLGNILNASYYVVSNPNASEVAGGDIVVTNDNGLVTTNRPVEIDHDFYILKIDSLGDPVWCREYGTVGYFQFVNELPCGDLLVGINMDPGGAAVGRMDANGNFIWLKSYIRPEGVMRDCEVENDSTFTVIGYTDKDSGPGTKLFMMRLNGIGDVQWCKAYDGPSGWVTDRAKLDKTVDGNYVVLGGYGKAFLMKTDLNGDTLWTRGAGVGGTYYEVRNLLAHSDGGFLFNGQGWGLGTFLFKADSLGRLPCPEHERRYNVQVQNLFPTDSSFTLTSIDGATRHPAFINDTLYPPVTTIEGCTVTQVPDYSTAYKKPHIRPNPNRGQFTVQFYDPLQVDSFYSVYDLAGKLLYQRPLPAGATTEDIDLSRFGKGTYLLKFTTPVEVWNERVVVE